MMLYEITMDSGNGYAECATRKREDAALLKLEQYVCDAAEAQGLRDRLVAHQAMSLARSWTKRHPIPPIRIGSYTITISADKLP